MTNSFCLYRLPNQEKVYFLEGTAVPIQAMQSTSIGFVFAPFFNDTGAYVLQGRAIEYNNETIKTVVDLSNSSLMSVSKEAYIAYTNSAINTIKRDGLAKIVMARNQVKAKPDNFNPIDFFNKMCAAYSQAFVYIWYSSETGMWMGATPEILIENKANSGTTMALAGTRTKDQF